MTPIYPLSFSMKNELGTKFRVLLEGHGFEIGCQYQGNMNGTKKQFMQSIDTKYGVN